MRNAADRRSTRAARALRLRTRLRFGLAGALAALAAAVLGELAFRAAHTAGFPDEPPARCLLFAEPGSDGDVAFDRRLQRAGAHGGDIQVSLAWQGPNDLDLWCLCPFGERVCFLHRRSLCGGRLDIDMNGRPPYSAEPVENVIWPIGLAPRGQYQVFVQHRSENGGAPVVPFAMSVRIRGVVRRFRGLAPFRDNAGDEDGLFRSATLACTFTYPEGNIEIADSTAPAQGRWQSPAVARAFAVSGAWGAVLGLFLAPALTAGVNRCRRLPTLPARQAAKTAVAGLGYGLAAGAAGQLLYALSVRWAPAAPPPCARLLGFAALGGLLGYGLSRAVSAIPRKAAVPVPAAAGAAAGIVVDLLTGMGYGIPARLVAAAAIGFAIGALVTFRRWRIETASEDILCGSESPTVALRARKSRLRTRDVLRLPAKRKR